MAFVEMWKSGKRVARRGPDGQRAPGGQGCLLRFESGQETRFTASGTTRIGDHAGGVLGGLPPPGRHAADQTPSDRGSVDGSIVIPAPDAAKSHRAPVASDTRRSNDSPLAVVWTHLRKSFDGLVICGNLKLCGPAPSGSRPSRQESVPGDYCTRFQHWLGSLPLLPHGGRSPSKGA